MWGMGVSDTNGERKMTKPTKKIDIHSKLNEIWEDCIYNDDYQIEHFKKDIFNLFQKEN